LIPEEPEFNLEYLRFAYQQNLERLCEQILEALYQPDDAKEEGIN